ncbi:MAG TPA: hypothetical protein GXZ45_07635 [Propionibacterium sp.]|nr:hypothetical protein [Propionibacterium sp.]
MRWSGDDADAGREVLNQALAAWQARVFVEEEVGPGELPGVEAQASALPEVPLNPPQRLRRARPGVRRHRLPRPVHRRR